MFQIMADYGPTGSASNKKAHQTLDVLVEGVEDHEDGGHVLVQVLHHRDGHRLDQVVPASGNFESPAKKPINFQPTFRRGRRRGWPRTGASSSATPLPSSRGRRCRRTPPGR